jgi:AcrR family transcriptional regulator
MGDHDADPVKRLPPGPHGLPPELVARNQRERLIAAMAEVCVERGYGAATVADVARTAGVSTASFYRQFEDRRECMLASFEELFGRLLEGIERACEDEADLPAKVKAGIEAAASLLAADLPTTRLLTVEIVAVGVEGVRIQHDAIERLATRLREARGPAAGSSTTPTSEWAAVAAAVALAAKRAAEDKGPGVAELEALF